MTVLFDYNIHNTQVHVRIIAVPIKIDTGQIGELISTSGIVVRMSQPTVMQLKKRFICKQCKHVTVVNVSTQTYTIKLKLNIK